MIERNTFSLVILAYILMIAVYVQTNTNWSYMGFAFDYSSDKFIMFIITMPYLFFLYRINSDNFTKAIFIAITLFYYFPVFIYYQFNNSASIDTVLAILIFLSVYAATFRIIRPKIVPTKKTKNLYRGLILLTCIIMLLFSPYIDIGVLFSSDVYAIRLFFREADTPVYLGYLFGIMSRVVLPFFIVYSLITKSHTLLALSLLSLLAMFSMGALKSVILGAALVIIFYFGSSYKDKISIILIGVVILFASSILEEFLLDTYLINDYFTRRVFFLPAMLQSEYFNEFELNHTLWMHTSFLSYIFDENIFNKPITFYVGEDVMGIKGHNASIGLITEGFVSYGHLGVFLHAFIFSLFLVFMRSFNFRHEYFGIIFIYLYIARTSFIFPLMASHALLFLIIFSWIFMSERKQNTLNI
jgi:hypothetical protein